MTNSDIYFSCHQAYRFDGRSGDRRIVGTVYRQPGSKGPWFATVDGTTIEVVMGGREGAVTEAIRQACLPPQERSAPTISRTL